MRILLLTKILFSFCILACFLLSSCGKKIETFDEFEKYMKSADSPYSKTITKDSVSISVCYMPADVMMVGDYKEYVKRQKEVIDDSARTDKKKNESLWNLKEELKKKRDEYKKSIYFLLTIGYENKEKDIEYERLKQGFGTYSQWLQRLLFHMNEYIFLKTPGSIEIPLSFYHMERTFGFTKDRTFLLVFSSVFNGENLFEADEISLIIKEFGMQTGSTRFTYDEQLDKKYFYLTD